MGVWNMNGIIRMEKELDDKIKLFRIIHGVDRIWVSENGSLYKEPPEDFSGKSLNWHENGNKRYEWDYKNGRLHGKSLGWWENGKLQYEYNYKNGEQIK